MLTIGSLVDGKYRILDEVGRGGMSVVYLARNTRTNKQWAIKEVRKDGTNNYDVVRSNLIAETDILKKLDHPNLPNIIDILDDGDSFIIIMDFIEGNSLQHYLKYSGAQAEEDVVQWAIQLCDVLGYLHSRKPPIVYRDMKPANIMLKPDGTVSLIDFGTAREYKETSVEDTKCLGTQGYAAPEQYGGHGQTDARTDVYCLGATIYHLVTGHNPAEPPYEMYPIRYWNPELSQGLEQIILKCTQKNPDDRFQSCEELMYALEHRELLDESVIRSQKRKLIGFFATVFMMILCVVGFFAFGSAESSALTQTYDNLVNNANKDIQSGDIQDGMKKYQEAVLLSPERGDAYIDALEELKKADDEFTVDDGKKVRDLLRGNSNDAESNESKFREGDPKAYAEFCYSYGAAYMLSEGSGTTYAEDYLKFAKDSQYITGSRKEIATCLYEMCEFSRIRNVDAGFGDIREQEDAKTYDQYWARMYELGTDSEIMSVFNSDRMVFEYYRFVISAISGNARDFVSAGVPKDEMYNLVAYAREVVSRLTNIDDEDKMSIDFDMAQSKIDAQNG